MKPLALLCLTVSAFFAGETLLLPHRWQDARHEMGQIIRTAETPLIFVTDTLDDAQLARALRTRLKKGRSVMLITSSERTASEWAMYRTLVPCLLLQAQPLGFTLVAAEDKGACTLSLPFETERMRSDYGVMQCSQYRDAEETVRLLKQECKGYFSDK